MDGTETPAMWDGSTAVLDELGSDDEETRVYEWRVRQLRRIGLSWALAYTFAPLVDWHDVAKLVERGCSPELALEIVR